MSSFAIVRLRPPGLKYEGLPDRRLRQIASEALGLRENEPPPSPGANDTFAIPDLHEPSPESAAWLKDILIRRAVHHGVVLLDLNFTETAVRFFEVQLLVLNATIELSEDWPPNSRLVILTSRVPSTSDVLRRVCSVAALGEKAVIIDVDGHFYRSDQAPTALPQRVADTATRTMRDLGTALERNILRRRGAFRVRTSKKREYSSFQYSVELEAARAELSEVLEQRFVAESASAIFYDDPGGDWLGEAVLKACLRLNLRLHLVSDLDPNNFGAVVGDTDMAGLAEKARASLADPAAKPVFVLPMLTTGNRLREIQDHLDRRARRVPVIAIFASDSLNPGALRRLGGRQMAIETVFPVPTERVGESDWRVHCALALNEIDRAGSSSGAPTVTAMLSLSAAYGFGPEYSTPRTRKAMGNFPQLDNIHPLDAYWLAECLLREVDARLRCRRNDILIVIPQEETASANVASALRNQLSVTVAGVSRAEIESGDWSDDAIDKVIAFSAKHIVIVDESTVTYSTLNKMSQTLEDIADRAPDLVGVIFDLTPEDLDFDYPFLAFNRRSGYLTESWSTAL